MQILYDANIFISLQSISYYTDKHIDFRYFQYVLMKKRPFDEHYYLFIILFSLKLFTPGICKYPNQ